MIDLHTHIFSGLDDGAHDLAESLAMLELAGVEGTHTIIATPHYDGADRDFATLATARWMELRRAAQECGFLIDVLMGFELQLTPTLLDWGCGLKSLGLNGGRYLLVELPQGFWPPYLHEVIFRLQALGLRPILAHAERYAAIARDPALATDLTTRGVLLQVNSDSLFGAHGRTVQHSARSLIERGLVSFLASDAHSANHRPPQLRAAAALASRLIGTSAAEQLVFGNPAAVVTDSDLPQLASLQRQRRFFDFARRVRQPSE